MSDPREKYWNDRYTDYWKKRVEEANLGKSENSEIVQGDKISTTDRNYMNAIDLLEIDHGDSVLELACGFGRSLPHLYWQTRNIHCLDISHSMVKEARIRNKELNDIQFHVGSAEETTFENAKFNHVICYASFDAFYQTKALMEINRILIKGGKVLLTGKNDNYEDDDTEAMIAEINARKKKEPNYFTNVHRLMDTLDDFGFGLTMGRYFPRRGDIVADHFVLELPEHFYEYLIILEKSGDPKPDLDYRVSHPYSRTYQRKHPE